MKKYFIILLFLSQLNCYAQRRNLTPVQNRFDKNISVDFGFGTASYLGDIYPSNNLYSYISTVRWNVSTNIIYQFSPLLSARFGFSWIRISADDFTFASKNMAANPQSDAFDLQFLRNLHFRNDLKEASLIGMVNLKNGFTNRRANRPNIMPYLLAGVALYSSSPQARDKFDDINNQLGAWTDVNISNTNSPIGLSIPIGLGVSKKLSPRLDFVAEICYRITFSDALDDIIPVPYQADIIPLENRSTELLSARTGESRVVNFDNIGNRQGFPTYNGISKNLPPTIGFPNPTPERGELGNDAYWTSNFKLRYYFNRKIKCP